MALPKECWLGNVMADGTEEPARQPGSGCLEHTAIQSIHGLVAYYADPQHRRLSAPETGHVALVPAVAFLQFLDAVLVLGSRPVRPANRLGRALRVMGHQRAVAPRPMGLQLLKQERVIGRRPGAGWARVHGSPRSAGPTTNCSTPPRLPPPSAPDPMAADWLSPRIARCTPTVSRTPRGNLDHGPPKAPETLPPQSRCRPTPTGSATAPATQGASGCRTRGTDGPSAGRHADPTG